MKLEASNLVSGYGRLTVLHGVSLDVAQGEVVAIVGPNGAGKSTLLKTLAGFLPVMSGEVMLDGERYDKHDGLWATRRGVILVPQTGNVFSDLSVDENLRLASDGHKQPRNAIEHATRNFPILVERANQTAGSLSGGERQALAVISALLMEPSVLLLDEPTTGLSPLAARATAELIDDAIESGVGVAWVVEQTPELALNRAERAYFMEGGRVTFADKAESLLREGRLEELMLQHG